MTVNVCLSDLGKILGLPFSPLTFNPTLDPRGTWMRKDKIKQSLFAGNMNVKIPGNPQIYSDYQSVSSLTYETIFTEFAKSVNPSSMRKSVSKNNVANNQEINAQC